MDEAGHRIFDLAGKIVVVTGGAKGIGAGIAEVAAKANATVVIVDQDEAAATRMAAAITDTGGSADSLALDLTDEAAVARGCKQITQAWGAPWALVNNAGIQDRELLTSTSTAFWDLNFSVNARGPFLMMRELLPAMIERAQGGRIVNIASAALIGSIASGHAAYAASKAALLGLARAAATELAAHAITVNTLLPGGVITPGSSGAKGPPPEGPATRRPPFGFSTPEDIGTAVLFFISREAAKITNQILTVDGGWSVT